MTANTLSRTERLKNAERISTVMAHRQSFSVYPLRVAYLLREDGQGQVKVAFSVSKKRFKHAVDRNRIKRLMRETYRIHKELLYRVVGEDSMDILFIYSSFSTSSYRQMEESMVSLLEKLVSKIRNLPKP